MKVAVDVTNPSILHASPDEIAFFAQKLLAVAANQLKAAAVVCGRQQGI